MSSVRYDLKKCYIVQIELSLEEWKPILVNIPINEKEEFKNGFQDKLNMDVNQHSWKENGKK